MLHSACSAIALVTRTSPRSDAVAVALPSADRNVESTVEGCSALRNDAACHNRASIGSRSLPAGPTMRTYWRREQFTAER